MTGYNIPRWLIRPLTVTHPSRPTNLAVHGRESKSQPVDHKSDALTTIPPSHTTILVVSWHPVNHLVRTGNVDLVVLVVYSLNRSVFRHDTGSVRKQAILQGYGRSARRPDLAIRDDDH